MSVIASFHVIDRADLPQVVCAAKAYDEVLRHPGLDDLPGHQTPGDVLGRLGRELADAYPWPGYCLLHLLTLLEDRGANLFESEYRSEAYDLNTYYDLTVLVTPGHRRHLNALDPGRYRDDEIRRHFAEMAYGTDEAPEAARDGLVLLRDQIAALGDEEILVVHIG